MGLFIIKKDDKMEIMIWSSNLVQSGFTKWQAMHLKIFQSLASAIKWSSLSQIPPLWWSGDHVNYNEKWNIGNIIWKEGIKSKDRKYGMRLN